jgi:hypothetical protein
MLSLFQTPKLMGTETKWTQTTRIIGISVLHMFLESYVEMPLYMERKSNRYSRIVSASLKCYIQQLMEHIHK